MNKIWQLCVAATLAFSTGVALAEDHASTEGKGHKPPKEALTACTGKKAGDACTFTGKEGKAVTGSCFTPEASKPLGCKPTEAAQH